VALCLGIRNVINEVGFKTFFQALLDSDTTEYKDLQLLVVLSERFWDTSCTFHFPGIGEMILTLLKYENFNIKKIKIKKWLLKNFQAKFIKKRKVLDKFMGSKIYVLFKKK